jgi:hypothetical protein
LLCIFSDCSTAGVGSIARGSLIVFGYHLFRRLPQADIDAVPVGIQESELQVANCEV